MSASAQAQAQAPTRPIQDNSFLVEEAYNQERGVVQHINTFQRAAGTWAYSFTQEWPVGGIRHQLSYTVPVASAEGYGTGLGDVGLNYRYQLVGSGETQVAVAPRVTVWLPTGSSASDRGSGAVGIQALVPASITLGRAFVTHLNLGLLLTPDAHGPGTDRATTVGLGAGASLIWLTRPGFNVMLETVWSRSQAVTGQGATGRSDAWFVSPGVRWAVNFTSGLQIVPGVAYSIGLGPSGGEDYLFLYLSFEHPFKH